jgi:bifunctional N-acetylglucosamine-1-phosphate-uridyltransferase/glucosamine-1-phosphate-acetyltransferase GlmU-like protein
VVSPDDPTVRELLGEDVVYVEQPEPRGTGDAVLAAREAVASVLGVGADGPVLVAYADTPLLRPESLLGVLTRHTLTGADLSLLSAVVDEPQPSSGLVVRADGDISAILEPEDRAGAPVGERPEVNVGAYVASPALLFRELEAMAAGGEHRLTELARRVIGAGRRISSYRIYDTDEVRGINTPDELQEAADVVLKRLFVPTKNTDTKIVFGTGGWRAVIGERSRTSASCARPSRTRPCARGSTARASSSAGTAASCRASQRSPPRRSSRATTSRSRSCPTTSPRLS